MDKFLFFVDNARELYSEFEIVPLLYGSLGLEVLTSTDLHSDDVNILIPEKYLKGKLWEKFSEYLEKKGYQLIDLNEHIFLKDDIKYSYASIESLKDFVGIDVKDIMMHRFEDISYLLLSLEQYLLVYQESSHDEYRKDVKGKNDFQKIQLIHSELERTK